MKAEENQNLKAGLQDLEDIINYRFSNFELLVTAMTHSSYANEHDDPFPDNERLEFLGDAVLELSVSDEIYRRYPLANEGALTALRAKLVSEPALADLGRQLGLQEYLLLGKGEDSQGGRERSAVLCDALEALFGAIFLDADFCTAQKCILRLYADLWPVTVQPPKKKDYKSQLQELTQKLFKALPKYILRQSTGPEHEKTYTVDLHLPNNTVIQAQGSSLKKAEQNAACLALKKLEKASKTEANFL